MKKSMARNILVILASLLFSAAIASSADQPQTISPLLYGIVEESTEFKIDMQRGYDESTAILANSTEFSAETPGGGISIARWSFSGSTSSQVEISVDYDQLKGRIGNYIYQIPYMLYNNENPVPPGTRLADLVYEGSVYYEAVNSGILSVKRTTKPKYPEECCYSSSIVFSFISH